MSLGPDAPLTTLAGSPVWRPGVPIACARVEVLATGRVGSELTFVPALAAANVTAVNRLRPRHRKIAEENDTGPMLMVMEYSIHRNPGIEI